MSTPAEDISTPSKRLADVVYERLCDAIVDGTYTPGQRIRDAELAETLGVSRMPVREALQRLERQGLIEMVASRFTRVTPVTPDMPAQSLEFIGYQFGIALRLAVPLLDADQRALTAALVRELAVAVTQDPRGAYAVGRRLGASLAAQSGNPLFQTMLDDAWLVLTRNLRGQFPLIKDPAEMRDEFAHLADLIERADAEGAEATLRSVFLLGRDQPGPGAAVSDLWDD
ncbi:GntR family transcriptional regulator [Microbacterium sp. G2-8]|uniref:GntR family transcriptional regulator n=1 Tax=Microbacterium sp. G2-8 TaxID=2842454 RepID=UPI001C8913AC|nr:GntR family transcriptional regulator [Microbacterium sp. G2-8]